VGAAVPTFRAAVYLLAHDQEISAMVIARFSGDELTKFQGGVKVKAYGYDKGGWFPVESFDFGFKEMPKQPDNKAPTGPATHKAPPPKPGAGAQKLATAEEKGFTEISLSKQIDKASCSLMYLALMHRTADAAKGEDSKIQADIHVISSFAAGDDRHIYPNIMLHMEGVLLTSWGISGGGDDRPKEKLAFKYSKVAMSYQPTPDAKYFDPMDKRGWLMNENKAWPVEDLFDKYLAINYFELD
jgi:type VI protein secretion system component Hcp